MSHLGLLTLRRQRAAISRRSLLIFCVLLSLFLLDWTSATAIEQVRLREDFTSGLPDEALWRIERREPPNVRVDLSGEKLRFVIPAGRDKRPAARMEARFRIEGDCDIQARYTIGSASRPSQGAIKLQIHIAGPDGRAAVTRIIHSRNGHGYAHWFKLADGRSEWNQAPARDTTGVLRLRRIGRELSYEVAADGADRFSEIGRVAFGSGPIESLEIRVIVPETRSPVDIVFDEILVEVDRIVAPSTPRSWTFNGGVWLAMTVLIVVVTATLWRSFGGSEARMSAR